jgi:hypothetical protein
VKGLGEKGIMEEWNIGMLDRDVNICFNVFSIP